MEGAKDEVEAILSKRVSGVFGASSRPHYS